MQLMSFDGALALLGLIIGYYCWWQAHYRLDNYLDWWLIGVICGVALFAYLSRLLWTSLNE
jgi:hypothetical protein